MLYRSVDAYGNSINDAPSAPGLIEKKYKNPVLSTVRTSTVSEPEKRGTNGVTRAEYEAVLRRVETLEAMLTSISGHTASISGHTAELTPANKVNTQSNPVNRQSNPVNTSSDALDRKAYMRAYMAKKRAEKKSD